MRFFPFYHLQENPFGETPDPKFYFAAQSHQSVLQKILWSIQENKAFVLVFGTVGSGKTLLSRVVFEQVKAQANIATLMNPNLDPLQILKTIYREFGIESEADLTKIDELASFLQSQVTLGKKNLLIIDEAQGLPFATLEFLRILTNLETANQKLLQIVVFAQPEMEARIQHPSMVQLQQRIFLRTKIERLSLIETKKYIQNRIEIAGGGNFLRFDDTAVRWIWIQTMGNPRLINKICEASILFGEKLGIRRFTKDEMRRLPANELGISRPTLMRRIAQRIGL
jgi:general secretion pathway protein A